MGIIGATMATVCRFLLALTGLVAIVTCLPASPDACATGKPVVVNGTSYATKTLIVTPGKQDADMVQIANTKVAAMVVGALEKDGSVFWKSSGDFDYVYDASPRQLIVGFDVGSYGMAIGETRQVCIPASEGYGQQSKPGIPANSTLVFTLTCDSLEAPCHNTQKCCNAITNADECRTHGCKYSQYGCVQQ